MNKTSRSPLKISLLFKTLAVGIGLSVITPLPSLATPIVNHSTIVPRSSTSSVKFKTITPPPAPQSLNTRPRYSISTPSRSYSDDRYYPRRREGIRNSILINPTIINLPVSDSVIINPTIVNPSRHKKPIYRHGLRHINLN